VPRFPHLPTGTTGQLTKPTWERGRCTHCLLACWPATVLPLTPRLDLPRSQPPSVGTDTSLAPRPSKNTQSSPCSVFCLSCAEFTVLLMLSRHLSCQSFHTFCHHGRVNACSSSYDGGFLPNTGHFGGLASDNVALPPSFVPPKGFHWAFLQPRIP
jgi:hypothetical protein